MSANSPDGEPLSPQRTLKIIRAFERAGGSASYENWLAEHSDPALTPRSTESLGEGGYSKKVPATMQLIPYVIGGYVEVTALDGDPRHHGTGWLWGVGGAVINSVGVFWYNDWSATTNSENKIVVSSYGDGVGAIGAHFSVGDSEHGGSALLASTGLFVGGGGGEGFAAVTGKFNWDPAPLPDDSSVAPSGELSLPRSRSK